MAKDELISDKMKQSLNGQREQKTANDGATHVPLVAVARPVLDEQAALGANSVAGEEIPTWTAPASGYGRYGSGPAERESHLVDYLRIIHKHRWIAASAFLLVVGTTALVTFTATPIYNATVQILIENEDPRVINFEQVLEESQRTNDYYQTQYKILSSRALARRTIDRLTLWDHPHFNPTQASASAGWSGLKSVLRLPINMMSPWISGPASAAAAGEKAGPDETTIQSATIDRFLSRLIVTPVRNSRLVDVTYQSPDPKLAADVANTLAKNYIDQNLEYKLMSSKEATEWLSQQLAERRKEVEATERALQDYRERNDAVSLEDRQNIVVQKLGDLNAAVTRARTERIQKQAAYDQIEALRSNKAALDTLPAIISNGFIQDQKAQLATLQSQQAQLSEKLGPRHPDMVRLAATIDAAQARMNAEVAKVVVSVRNDFQQALAQEQSLTAALDQQKREALELNRKGIDYSVLARDAAANRQVFESVMQRMKETGVSSELRTNNVRVVDEAEIPRRPATPRIERNLFLSLPVGLLLAVGLSFFFEYLDNRIKNPEEIKAHLSLPFMGIVPAVQTITSRLTDADAPATFVESFRTLRTNLMFCTADSERCRTLMVTSTGPGEGKTLVSSNLAMALALAGERVILIDADMRKPRVHEVFGKARKPGLSNVLAGNAKAAESVHKADVPGLWVLSAGDASPNPSELLGSRRYRDLIASLAEHFDRIVIDTPPVMVVTDAVVVGHWTDGVLFVIGSEMTPLRNAQRAVEQLDNVKAKLLGAVLNRVDLKHNSYYYSDYYRREYRDYYEASAS